MEILAPAKINLTLCVLGKRPDGYHELESVMQMLTLADVLEVEEAPGLTLTCTDPALEGNDNLVLRAARLLRVHYGCSRGAHIHLTKRIPVQAGLGGGSSDGAAALKALNLLWDLKIPPSRLCTLAKELGSDVPFFLNSPSAVVQGRGERVRPILHHAPIPVVLVKPRAGLSTPQVYSSLITAPCTPAEASPDTMETQCMLRALRQGDAAAIADCLINDLEEAAMPLLPELVTLRRRLLGQGCLGALLCGSGSAMFGLCPDDATAERAAQALATDYPWTATAMFSLPNA